MFGAIQREASNSLSAISLIPCWFINQLRTNRRRLSLGSAKNLFLNPSFWLSSARASPAISQHSSLKLSLWIAAASTYSTKWWVALINEAVSLKVRASPFSAFPGNWSGTRLCHFKRVYWPHREYSLNTEYCWVKIARSANEFGGYSCWR